MNYFRMTACSRKCSNILCSLFVGRAPNEADIEANDCHVVRNVIKWPIRPIKIAQSLFIFLASKFCTFKFGDHKISSQRR